MRTTKKDGHVDKALVVDGDRESGGEAERAMGVVGKEESARPSGEEAVGIDELDGERVHQCGPDRVSRVIPKSCHRFNSNVS